MIVNPIIMEGGGQVLERRPTSPGMVSRVSSGQGRVDGVSPEMGVSEITSRFESSDQLSKGLGGRVVTPEWQQKIGLSHGVQVADQAMGEIDQKLQQAKADLMEIHKMFPPYPHGSEERAELLNSYKSLRLQIDQLTFPPDSDSASMIMGNPPVVEGEPLPEVGQFPVYSGLGGLELFELNGSVEDIKDSELPAVIENLEQASEVLSERRTSLEVSFRKINQDTGEDAEIFKLSYETQEQLAAYKFSMGRSETGVHQDLPSLG